MNTKRVLSLWLPNWPIQRLVVSEPELRRQRIVLFRHDARRGQLVAAVSPLAMQDGACVDMPLSEAKSLLQRSTPVQKANVEKSDFYIFEHDPKSDLEALESLADSLESFSPTVGLKTVDQANYKQGRRPNSILLEVTGLAHLFGDEHQLARQVLLHCDSQGYLPRIAIADTVGAAWAMARYVAGQYFAQHQQPLVLTAGDQETLQQLPVESLCLEPAIINTLYQLGVETVRQLQQLPRNDLAMRFGNSIHRRIDQMTGEIDEPVIARRKPAKFIAEQLLEYPTHHRKTIEVIIGRLVGRLCEQMRAKQRGALEWAIKLVCQVGSPLEFRVNLFQPTALTNQVMPLVEMQLEQILLPHMRKFRRHTTIQVQEITVSVTSDALLAQQQRQLFDENPRLDRQSLAHLINRLANRLGTQNVVYPTLQAGAQPEYSFRLRPLVDPNRKQRRRKTKPPKQSHTLARPLRLFCPPLRLKKIEVNHPVSTNDSSRHSEHQQPRRLAAMTTIAPPALFRIESSNARSQKIIASSGPERIETGWWRSLTVCRDYWRIETETHQHYWVFRDLRSNQWYLHGEF